MARADGKLLVALEFQSNNASLSRATRGIQSELATLQRRTATVASSMTSFVPAFAAVGAAAFSAFSFAGRAAVQFEDSFAGVKKTLNFTGTAAKAQEANFKSLAKNLVDLSRTTPMAANELARIGEIGGQLGISAGNITEFTKTISQLTVATTMSAEEASFALSRLAAITRIPERNIDNLASVIVRLGNEFAATESEIVGAATKIAAALELIESPTSNAAADSLALAAALKQVGQQTQAGSTAVARALDIMATAVMQGGRELSIFSKVANMSSASFRALAEASPAEAFVAFLDGLAAVGNAGADTVQLLEELGLGQQRTLRALRSMALASGDVKAAMTSANEEFALNNALQTEAEKRYETVVSQMGILRNNVTALGIETGNQLLKPLNEVLETLTILVGGTTQGGLGRLAKGFATIAVAINAMVTANKKFQQINALAMEQGMQGTGIGGAIRMRGDVLKGRGDRKSFNLGQRLANQEGPIEFNADNFLAQQASQGRNTAGMRNVIKSAQMQGIDLFDQKDNERLVSIFGDDKDMMTADLDDESLGLSAKDKAKIEHIRAINAEEGKSIELTKKEEEINEKIIKQEEKKELQLQEQLALEEKINDEKQKSKTVEATGPQGKFSASNIEARDELLSQLDEMDQDQVISDTEMVYGGNGKFTSGELTLGQVNNQMIEIQTEMRRENEALNASKNRSIAIENQLSQEKDKSSASAKKLTEQLAREEKIQEQLEHNLDDLSDDFAKLTNKLSDAEGKAGLLGKELNETNREMVASSGAVEKLEKEYNELGNEIDQTTGSIDRLNKKLDASQKKGRKSTFMGTVENRGVMDKATFGSTARSLGPAIKQLASYGKEQEQVNTRIKRFISLLRMSRKDILAANAAMQQSKTATASMKLAFQGITSAITAAKAALASFITMMASMVAFTLIFGYFTKLRENALKTSAAIKTIGDEMKTVIDLQKELDFQDLQRGVIENALNNELAKSRPDKNLVQSYRNQLDNIDKGIAGARAQVEENMAELGKTLLLETTEQGVNIKGRIEAISQALGTTFDKDEFFRSVGESLMDFENVTANSLLTGLQNIEETQAELDTLLSQPSPNQQRIADLEREVAVFEMLNAVQLQYGDDFESLVERIGDGAFRDAADTFTGGLVTGSDALVGDSLAGVNFEILPDGSVEVFKGQMKEVMDTYGMVTNTFSRESIIIFDKETFAGKSNEEIERYIHDFEQYLVLSDTLRRQATGKNVGKAMQENSTFIQMQNEGLVKQAQFLKQNGIILQDIDPFKDRQRAIKEVTRGTALFHNQQLAQVQQTANSMNLLEFQMTKFEKELNKSLQKASSTVANVFGQMPVTVKKSINAMVEEMFIKEARLKNFQNNIKRLASIAPMLAKQMADQGIQASRQVEQLLKDPVAAFAIEASLVRMTPFTAEELGLTEDEIARMEESGLRLGESASEGIIIGLQNKQDQLEQTFVSSMKGALDAVEYYIEKGSPSRLFAREVGGPMIDGIIAGVEQNRDNLMSATVRVVEDAVEATLELMTELESVSELSQAAQALFAVTQGARDVTAANFAVQKSEQALMATRRQNATLQERITKNQIALQKAELEGRKNNITMTEEMSVLSQKIAIDEMKRKMAGNFSASERKAIADAEEELENLRLAAEAGIVDALDVEVAEERLSELKGTNKTIDEQRLAILELATAEEALDEENKKIREVDSELIQLREENIKLLDEQANAGFELQTAYDNLEAATENVVTQELKYSEAREKFIDFYNSAPEIFAALEAGYGGVGGVIDATRNKVEMLTNSVETGADKAIQKLIDVVTEAQRTASFLQSVDLLTDTKFDPTGTNEGQKQANTRATATDFIKQMGANNPLKQLLSGISDANVQSAIEAGKVDASTSSVFSDTNDFVKAQTALDRVRTGNNVSFADFANAISAFLGVNTKLDRAGNINFSETGLASLGLTPEQIKQVNAMANTSSGQGMGTAVLGGTEMDLMGVGGDLAERGGSQVQWNFQDTIPGISQDTFDLKNDGRLIAAMRLATGKAYNQALNGKDPLEQVLEDLSMRGATAPSNFTQQQKDAFKKVDASIYYQNNRYGSPSYMNDLFTALANKMKQTLTQDQQFGVILKRKYGGNVRPFQRALVGEYGPEFVTAMPGGGLRVTPQGSERGGSINVENVNVQVTGVPTDPLQARKAAVQIQKALVNLEKEGTSGNGLMRR